MSSKLPKSAPSPPGSPKTDQLQQVRKRKDLLSLSLVSKRAYGVLREQLWTSITIDIPEDSLDRVPLMPVFPVLPPGNRSLDYTREVHFSSGFVRNIENRCPHCSKINKLASLGGGDGADGDEDEIDDGGPARFERLEEGAASVLSQLQKGTLRSFR